MHKRNLKHYPELLPEFIVLVEQARERLKQNLHDEKGGATSIIRGPIRFIAIMTYLTQGDVRAFRDGLSEVAALKLSLFERFDAGEPIDRSYVSMLSYKSLFDALAAGNIALAKSLSARMGGRDDLEKQFDHPFDYALGYMLKSFIDDSGDNLKRHYLELFREQKDANFLGYADVLEALEEKDEQRIKTGFKSIIKGHQKESKGNGFFARSEDEVLSIWGIGLANFVRSKGVNIEIDDPLIPADLLI